MSFTRQGVSCTSLGEPFFFQTSDVFEVVERFSKISPLIKKGGCFKVHAPSSGTSAQQHHYTSHDSRSAVTRQAMLRRRYHLRVVVWSTPGGREQAEPWRAEHLCDIRCVCGQQCWPTGWRCLLFGPGISSCACALPCPALPFQKQLLMLHQRLLSSLLASVLLHWV